MFIVDVLMPWDDIPNGKISYQETFSDALKAAERIVQESGGARSIEIFEADDQRAKNKRLIAVLRTIR
jgi:sulfite reductase alpha subunit-like flavoprotein